jgi:hypothetical protein
MDSALNPLFRTASGPQQASEQQGVAMRLRQSEAFSRTMAFMFFTCVIGVSMGSSQTIVKPSGQIVAIDLAKHLVTARDVPTGRTFEFTLQNTAIVNSLKVGQGVYANFVAKQVSLDGRTVAGQIVNVSAIIASPLPAMSRPVDRPVARSAERLPAAGPASSLSPARSAVAISQSAPPATSAAPSPSSTVVLPTLRLAEVEGKPTITVLTKQNNLELRHLSASVEGKQVETNVLSVTGTDAIESAFAQGLLPEAARDALLAHAKNLQPGDIPTYVVNQDLAKEWAKTHTPLPKGAPPQTAPRGSNSTRHPRLVYASYHLRGDPEFQDFGKAVKHAAGEVSKGAKHAESEASKDAEHAGGQISDAYKNATGQTTAWWRHWQREGTKDWEKVEDCWVDHKISARRHVTFHPEHDLGYTANLASLKLGEGTVNVQIPIDLSLDAEASVFYIPCMAVATGSVPLPFFIRPRDVSAQNGQISIAANVSANIQHLGYKGDFSLFAPRVTPILYPTLIMAGPVPIEFAVYLYLRGGIKAVAEADIESSFVASDKKEGPFSFTCNGHGCEHDFSKIKTESSVPMDPALKPNRSGRLIIEPYFWSAVQIDVYNGLLMGRAGPEAAVSGDMWGYQGSGCGSGVAASGGLGDNVKALTADIDAKLYAAWQVGAMGMTDPFTGEYIKGLKGYLTPKNESLLAPPFHLFFRDFVGSSALTPLVAQNGTAYASHPAGYKVQMRPCYPYPDEVEYQMQWSVQTANTGTPSGGTGQSQNSSSAHGLPQEKVLVNHTWTVPGDSTLTISAVRDKHGRKFLAEPTRFPVHVQEQPSTTAMDKK